MIEKIKRQLDQLEKSMGARNDGPRVRIQVCFVGPETGEKLGPLFEVPHGDSDGPGPADVMKK